MTPFETITVDGRVAACNGGGGPLGHPRVYLNLMPAGAVECPYCSRLYVNPAIATVAHGDGEGATGIQSPADKEGPPYPEPRAAPQAEAGG